jgi:hypothetical protein
VGSKSCIATAAALASRCHRRPPRTFAAEQWRWITTRARVLEAGRSFVAGSPTQVAAAYGAAAGLAALFSWWALRGLRKAEAAG